MKSNNKQPWARVPRAALVQCKYRLYIGSYGENFQHKKLHGKKRKKETNPIYSNIVQILTIQIQIDNFIRWFGLWGVALQALASDLGSICLLCAAKELGRVTSPHVT